MSLFNKFIKETIQMQKDKDFSLQDNLQKDLLKEIQELSGRKLVAYFANLANENNLISPIDKSYIVSLIDSIPSTAEELDFIILSPGGFAESVDMIVKLLRLRFNHVRFIIPNMAKSAATMLALSGNEIVMRDCSELGPIDPQVRRPNLRSSAQAIIDGFDDIKKIVEEEGHLNGAYVPILNNVDVSLMLNCRIAIEYGKNLVTDYLTQYMFSGEEGAKEKSEKITTYLSEYTIHMTHERPIYRDELIEKGVKVINLEDLNEELANKIWEYHYRFEFIMQLNRTIAKIFHSESEYMVVRHQALQMVPVMAQPTPPKPGKKGEGKTK